MGKFVQNNPSIRAFVVGHNDNGGTLDYNLDLSNRRAAAVAKRSQASTRSIRNASSLAAWGR
jgi:outer membrane protein OmpA-like peptidoglycan-associated protein